MPQLPTFAEIAFCTKGIPSRTPGSPCTPDKSNIIAVAEQINRVSINTDNTCPIPCFAGWLTEALADAFGALPIPASLEKSPLLIPITTALPAIPPANA